MITINGVEYGLFWSIWAHCRFDDWLMKNRTASYPTAIVKKAVIANEAYRLANGVKGPELTEVIIHRLPNSEYVNLQKTVEEQVLTDSGITIKKEDEPAGKNAEGSAAESN